MTREEVIKALIKERKTALHENKQAFDMAIKALEQQPSEDCVSRQAVLDMATTIQTDDYSGNEIMEVIDVDDIKALPSVTPTRKTGEWCKQNDDYFDWYECSECGYGSEGEMQYSSEYDVRTNYCPNCGAEMEDEE